MTDRDMYEKLFLEHADSIYRFVYLRTSSKEKAEDIAAETFKRMLEKQDLKPELAKYWLFTVARNLMYDMFKKESGKQVIDELIEESELNIDDSGDYDENLIDDELLGKLETYIDQLSPKSKEVISLKIWEEMQFNQIADLLSEKESTVKLRYYRGLEKLQELVSKDYDTKKITIPLVLGGFALLGTQPAYAAPPAFISTFISANLAMSTIATGAAAASTTGSTTSAAATTSATASSAASASGTGIMGMLTGTNGIIVASVGTAVVAGTAIVAAVAGGFFSSNNSGTPNSYPDSYNQPASYTEVVTEPELELDPTTNTTRFTSKNYDFEEEAFYADLPEGWTVEETAQSGNFYGQNGVYSNNIVFSKQDAKINIDQILSHFEGVSRCNFNNSMQTLDSPYFAIMQNQEFIDLNNHDYAIAYTDTSSFGYSEYNFHTGQIRFHPINLNDHSNRLGDVQTCGTFDKQMGHANSRFGTISIQKSTVDTDQLFEETKFILASLTAQDGDVNFPVYPFEENTSSAPTEPIPEYNSRPFPAEYVLSTETINVTDLGNGKKRFTSKVYPGTFNSVVNSGFSIEVPNDWVITEYIAKEESTGKVIGYEIEFNMDDYNTVLTFLNQNDLDEKNVQCRNTAYAPGFITSTNWISVLTQDNVDINYTDASYFNYFTPSTPLLSDRELKYVDNTYTSGMISESQLMCEFDGDNGTLLTEYGFIHNYSSLSEFETQMEEALRTLKRL